MNSQQRAAMQMALEALEYLIFADVPSVSWIDKTDEAITALREALAQPQVVTEGNASEVRSTDTGEPVAWQFFQDGKWWNGSEYNCHRQNTEDAGIPVRNLYTNPPSVEDMRIETLEKAAKMCDGMSDLAERQELKPRASFYRQCAAAIRSLCKKTDKGG
jgi:hypothetical protein